MKKPLSSFTEFLEEFWKEFVRSAQSNSVGTTSQDWEDYFDNKKSAYELFYLDYQSKGFSLLSAYTGELMLKAYYEIFEYDIDKAKQALEKALEHEKAQLLNELVTREGIIANIQASELGGVSKGTLAYDSYQKSIEGLKKINIRIDELADKIDGLHGTKLSKLNLENALSLFTERSFAFKLSGALGHAFNVEKLASLLMQDVGNSEQEMSDALKGWLNFSAGLTFDYAEAATGGLFRKIDGAKFIKSLTKLSPKTLLGITLRGVVVGIASDLAYEGGYAVGTYLAKKIAKDIHGWFVGKDNAQELYDQQWVVDLADQAIPALLGHLDEKSSNAAIALNFLITRNLRNVSGGLLPVETAAELFGSDDYKTVDPEKVIATYQKMHELFSGNKSAQSVKTLADLAVELQKTETVELFNKQFGANILIYRDFEHFNFDHFATAGKHGLAIRYALKHLNPFYIVSEHIDYNQLNHNGELDLFSLNNPNGMTETYIRKRVEMLNELWINNGIGSNKRFSDSYYEDQTQNITIGGKIWQGQFMSAEETAQTLFGSNGADELQAGGKQDYLFGGAGSDTLKGAAGNDYMEGGSGSDTYHIEDQDTVFDSDMEGKLLFGKVKAAKFIHETGGEESVEKTDTVWFSQDKKLVAARSGNGLDLIITEIGSSNQATIKGFFKLAKEDDNGGLIGLGIHLDVAKLVPIDADRLVQGINNRFNLFYTQDTQRVHVQGGEKDDTLMAKNAAISAQMGNGNDLVYGSLYADKLEGGDGNDIINGSMFVAAGTTKPKAELDKDADTVIGGNGHDLINGMAGDDIIHTGANGEHLNTRGTNERGDWALGHLGDDTIYGSRGQDFLQGGEGTDIIYGGADNDVILGDGSIRFGNKRFRLSGTPPSHEIEYLPGGFGGLSPSLISRIGNAIGVEHTAKASDKDGNHTREAVYQFDATDKSNDKWSVTIDSEAGDYALTSTVPAVATNTACCKTVLPIICMAAQAMI